jgi:3-hydroxyacyl-CoA dehydrogenase
MNNSFVSYQQQDQIGIIRVNNPPVNALSQAVRAGLMDALAEAKADGSQVLLILCEGRTFFAGADISEFGKPPQPPNLPELLSVVEHFPKPVVTALHGTALGGGLEVALAAHYRCAAPTTRLGLPEVKLGLLPGAGGTQRLPRVIGPEAALDMMTSGAPISVEKAQSLGLVDTLLEGELEAGAIEYCTELIADKRPVRPTGSMPVKTPSSPDFFDNYRKRIARKSRGQIAPDFIIELVELATRTDIEEGLARERERFIECRNSPQSSALRHVFFAERATGKLPDIPADTATLPIHSVAIIGAGTMGGGIAMCFANAGVPVVILEAKQEFLDRGMGVIRKNYATSVKRGRFTEAQVDGFLANISGTIDYTDIADVDMVIEAVFENMDVKKEVFAKLDAACKPGCVLATNTSYLDVDEIAAVTRRPQQVVGAHFFSPANVMKLLEVVRAEKTSPEVLQTLMKTARKIGKIPVAVGVCHGFVGNRMLKGYARQAQLLLLEGAGPEQVDGAMESWGMAMGPIAVSDLAGLDVGYRSRRDQGIESRSVKEFTLSDTLVEMERLGQKAGAGYYRYDPDTRKRQPDAEVVALIESIAIQWKVERRDIRAEEIVDRLVLALVNEGAAILQEGIAARPSDIDIVYLNGYGFPAWRGGPMFYADTLGVGNVVEKLNALKTLTGDPCWEPNSLLVNLAEKGRDLNSLN